MANAADLLKRDGQLRSHQGPWLSGWRDIAEHVAPEKVRALQEFQQGPLEAETLYDSTAIHASKNLASMIHGTMTPSTQPWISFMMRDDTLNETQGVKTWLEDVATRIHKALRQSNFNTAIHEFDLDLVRFGTACMIIEEKDPPADGSFGGFRFDTRPIGTYRVAEDKEGRVDTVFADLKLSRRVCVAMWGQGCGPDFLDKAALKPDELVDVLHAVYPRKDRAYDQRSGEPKAGSRNLPWASCYVLKQERRVASEGGFEENPYVVARWIKSSGEVYGTGPSHTAIYDVRTLNAFKMFWLQAVPLAMQPPSLERSDMVQGDIDRAPGGRIIVDGTGALTDQFMFLDTKYNPQVSETFIIANKAEIERQYHADQLQLREAPDMTATEVQVRYELMQRILGPTTGRLENEKLNPLAWRCFSIMARRQGAFLALPGALQEAVGSGSSAADLDLQYEGPLARAQRTVELTAQDRVVAFVSGIAQILAPISPQMAQQVWDVLKLDKMVRDRAEITGLAADSLNGDEEVQAMRDQRQQEAAKQQQLAKAQQVSEIGKNLAPLMQQKPGQQGMQGKAA